MKTATSIKLDKDVKRDADKLAKKLGLSLSSIINASLKQAISERRVVFSVEPELNQESENIFLKAISDIKAKRKISGPFKNTADLKKSLLG